MKPFYNPAMSLALDDLVVLDLSHALAGPFASTLLGDYGAEIVKIEPPDGELSREWGPPFYGPESAYFVNLNRNKKSVAIDLKHADGRDLFLRLVEHADVVLENMRVGAVAKLGIDYARARQRNPRIVYCSISGFGQDGPYRDRAALDLIVQAESGMISVTGEPGRHGVRARARNRSRAARPHRPAGFPGRHPRVPRAAGTDRARPRASDRSRRSSCCDSG